jgi:hypothetical protein
VNPEDSTPAPGPAATPPPKVAGLNGAGHDRTPDPDPVQDDLYRKSAHDPALWRARIADDVQSIRREIRGQGVTGLVVAWFAAMGVLLLAVIARRLKALAG